MSLEAANNTTDATEKPITTGELLQFATQHSGRWLEAALILKKPFLAVHLLCFDGKKLWDEGVDGKRRKLRPEQFEAEYTGQWWIVQQVV